ncbi:MAG: hypothetical protein BMS9Abin05_2521 [Rhodothermia bacterium]|nr:MAG: hypothetical protein BMS9Abin05_2521 [Rhodothermia bacterium]
MVKSCPIKLGLPTLLILLSSLTGPVYAQSSILLLKGSPDSVEVFIDGAKIGETNVNGTIFSDEIVAGRRTILLRKSGYLDKEIKQEFLPGLAQEISISLIVETASILDATTTRHRTVLLESNISDADVFVDSLYISRTDDGGRLLINVPVGTRSVTVKKIGYGSIQENIYLEPSRFAYKLSIELDPVRRTKLE